MQALLGEIRSFNPFYVIPSWIMQRGKSLQVRKFKKWKKIEALYSDGCLKRDTWVFSRTREDSFDSRLEVFHVILELP